MFKEDGNVIHFKAPKGLFPFVSPLPNQTFHSDCAFRLFN